MVEPKVRVETNGDSYANLEHGRVYVEIEKDGDSPSCPNSWTWSTWLDGEPMNSTCDEKSLRESMSDIIASIDETIEQLSVMSEYLKAYDVLCGRLREASDE